MTPTTAVALGTHALTLIISGLVWLRATQLRATDLRDFGSALPAPTQFMYDFQLPGFIFGALALGLTGALVLRKPALTVALAVLSVLIGLPLTGFCWWAMRLPL